MRIDCRFYESRTYGNGETVRMCRLDMAPEAPWRCPDDCPKFDRKLIDGGWVHGSLVNTPTPEPPKLDEAAINLLDQAENIINAAGPQIIEEVQAQRSKAAARKKRRWWPFGRG